MKVATKVLHSWVKGVFGALELDDIKECSIEIKWEDNSGNKKKLEAMV